VLPEKDDKIKSGKQFAEFASELLDTEVQQAYAIIMAARNKYAGLHNTPGNLEKLRDEVLTRLSEVGIIATFDPAPCLYGEPPVIEITGKVRTDSIHTYGFDHEQKEYEVRKSKERGEDYLGQKGRANTRRVKDDN
jgi:hypothetical protein